MLEEILSHYQGTLIVVSHDRDFLDQTVTKTLAFEGDGKIEQVIGGYSDYLAMKKGETPEPKKEKTPKSKKPKTPKEETPKAPRKRLTYKLERELKLLPGKLERTEKEIAELSEQLADTEFYTRDPDGFHDATKSLSEAQSKLERYENRWLELEEMKTAVKT